MTETSKASLSVAAEKYKYSVVKEVWQDEKKPKPDLMLSPLCFLDYSLDKPQRKVLQIH